MTETQTPPQPTVAEPKASRWKYVERLKLCLEIAAILTAGVWAYTRFIHDEAPSLELRADFGAKLGWEKVTTEQCQAEYELQFQNIGKLPIDIAENRVSVWQLSDPPKLPEKLRVEYIDPMALREEPALYSKTNNRLTGVYLPGEKSTEGFSFVLRNSPGKRILFEVELWSRDDWNKKERPPATWHDFHWDVACGDQTERAVSGKQ